jgi:hypothetical protein
MTGGVISFWVDASELPQVVDAGHPLPVTAAIPVVAAIPKGYQQIVGLAASTALTVPAGSTYALITTQAQAVRWRDDGVAPTATVGMELLIGQALRYDGNLAAIAFIQEAATATLNVAYYA